MNADAAIRAGLIIFHTQLLLMAAIYGGIAWVRGSPVTAELYGPAVYEIPAVAWAGAQVGSALVCIIGAMVWGRAGMWALIIGGAMSLAFYGSLAALASYTSSGLIAQAGALGVGATGAAVSLFIGLWARRNDRNQ